MNLQREREVHLEMRTQKTTTTVVVAVRSIVRTDGPTDATNTDVVFRNFDKTKNTLFHSLFRSFSLSLFQSLTHSHIH